MGHEPASIFLKWQELEQKQVRIAPNVWKALERYCLCRMDDISLLVGKMNGAGLAVEDARVVLINVMAIQKFIDGIRLSDKDAVVSAPWPIQMDRVALDLIHHYIGNELYKIVLIADVCAHDHRLIPGARVQSIFDCVKEAKVFLQRLKERTDRVEVGIFST